MGYLGEHKDKDSFTNTENVLTKRANIWLIQTNYRMSREELEELRGRVRDNWKRIAMGTCNSTPAVNQEIPCYEMQLVHCNAIQYNTIQYNEYELR